MITAINIIAQENVIIAFDIAHFGRNAPKVEEAHQILVLSMHVPENFHGRIDAQDHRLLLDHFLALVRKCDNVLSAEGEIAGSVELSRPLPRPQEMVQKQRIERVYRVYLFGLHIFFCGVCCVLLFFFPVQRREITRLLTGLRLDFKSVDSDSVVLFRYCGQRWRCRTGSVSRLLSCTLWRFATSVILWCSFLSAN